MFLLSLLINLMRLCWIKTLNNPNVLTDSVYLIWSELESLGWIILLWDKSKQAWSKQVMLTIGTLLFNLFISKVGQGLKHLFGFVSSWRSPHRMWGASAPISENIHLFCFTFFKRTVKTFATLNTCERRVWSLQAGPWHTSVRPQLDRADFQALDQVHWVQAWAIKARGVPCQSQGGLRTLG